MKSATTVTNLWSEHKLVASFNHNFQPGIHIGIYKYVLNITSTLAVQRAKQDKIGASFSSVVLPKLFLLNAHSETLLVTAMAS